MLSKDVAEVRQKAEALGLTIKSFSWSQSPMPRASLSSTDLNRSTDKCQVFGIIARCQNSTAQCSTAGRESCSQTCATRLEQNGTRMEFQWSSLFMRLAIGDPWLDEVGWLSSDIQPTHSKMLERILRERTAFDRKPERSRLAQCPLCGRGLSRSGNRP
jgi:hypothetical protein